MLLQKEIESFQKIVLQETGTKITYEEAKEWAEDLCGLMTLLIVPPEQHYSTLLFDTEKTIFEDIPS